MSQLIIYIYSTIYIGSIILLYCYIEYRYKFITNLLCSNKIRTKKLDKIDVCYICYDTIDSTVILLCNCKANYHKKCILTWLSKNNVCPICRLENPIN
jgi:hypothetical protein